MIDIEDHVIPKNFSVKVTLIGCSQLIVEEGSKDTPCPYVIIKVADDERETILIRDTDQPTYNVSFDFLIKTTVSDLKTMKILFNVWHKNVWYKRDILIGSHSVDVWTVYSKSTHMINKVWCNLVKEGNSDPGFISYSVVAVSEGDKMIGLQGDNDEEEQPEDGGETKKKVLLKDTMKGLPPISNNKCYQLSVDIFQGEFAEIPGIKDLNLKCKIIVSETEYVETLPKSKTQTPGWKEQHYIPIKLPFFMDFIVIEVYHDEYIFY